jgi:cytoskeleton protein RodZ
MTEQQQNMEQMRNEARVDAGAILREARERTGMSVEDVAGRLKFAPRQIAALEEGNYDELPELAYVRGFVRSYAKLLHLDEAPLLDALPVVTSHEAFPEKAARKDLLPNAAAGTRTQNIRWLAGALVVAALIGIVAWQHEEGQKAAKPAAAAAKSGAEVKSGEGNAPKAETPGFTAIGQGASAPAAAHAVHENAKLASTSASAAVISKEKTVHKHTDRLVRLQFDEDSWVEVKDGNGKVLLSQMGQKGSEQSVSGVLPLSLVIGNAKGVKLYYKGEPFDLDPYTDVDVARLTLE